MKKLIILLVVATFFVSLVAGCGGQKSKCTGDYCIAVVTGTVAQSEDELRGAEALIELYGRGEEGGLILHATYPDSFMDEQETTIATIASFADDPKVKAIVVDQGVPGTAVAFQQVREARPDILLIIGSPHDDWPVASAVSDLMVDPDFVARGYLMILAAKRLGAENFVHISFPRHMGYTGLARRAAIMEEACKDLGMGFYHETAPDPTSEVGIPGAQAFISEEMPGWVDKYGKNTVFFCTNDAQTEPLLKRIAELGAMFIEPDLPSPIMGYPGAFGIDLSAEAGDWPAILNKVEEAVVEAGGGGRMGTWAYSINYTAVLALGEMARRVIDGEADISSFDDLMDCFELFTPGARWNGGKFIDVDGSVCDNYFTLYQDTYILGKGYMNLMDEVVPEKYFSIK